jgi:hypothetical protein
VSGTFIAPETQKYEEEHRGTKGGSASSRLGRKRPARGFGQATSKDLFEQYSILAPSEAPQPHGYMPGRMKGLMLPHSEQRMYHELFEAVWDGDEAAVEHLTAKRDDKVRATVPRVAFSAVARCRFVLVCSRLLSSALVCTRLFSSVRACTGWFSSVRIGSRLSSTLYPLSSAVLTVLYSPLSSTVLCCRLRLLSSALVYCR